MTPDSASLLARLREHRTVGSAPEAELAWLVSNGTYVEPPTGTVFLLKGQPPMGLGIVLSGRVAIYVDRGTGARKILEWRAGDIWGALPYSRMVATPGSTIVEESAALLLITSERFPELIRECPTVTAATVHIMLDRARAFASSDWQDAKMVSLGKLAAGLAHELNNPSSAAARSAKQLTEAIGESERAARALAEAGLTAVQLDAIDNVHEICLASTSMMFLTPLMRSDREEQFIDWLSAHGADVGAAATIADTPAEVSTLDLLGSVMSGASLDAAIRWIAAGCLTRSLVIEVHQAATRINDLVGAIKRFTYMDRSSGPETVDIAPGLIDAVTVAGSKARQKSVAVVVDISPELPHVWGAGGELNQVWANLLDNAIDAAGTPGRVDLSARVETEWVIVRFVDNGAGIPADVAERIFDPFFTTKPIGQGSGLGLDIAQRIVRRYNGAIEVDSQPGRTEFRVRLPLPAARPSAPDAEEMTPSATPA